MHTPHPYDLVIGLDRSDRKADLHLIHTASDQRQSAVIDTSPEALWEWLSAAANERFDRIRALLDWQPPKPLLEPPALVPQCPCCRKPMLLIARLPRPPPAR